MSQPLAETIFWIAALACIVAELAILRSSFAQTGANSSSLVPVSSRRTELAWTMVPAVALVVLLVFTWNEMKAANAHRHPAPGAEPGAAEHIHAPSA